MLPRLIATIFDAAADVADDAADAIRDAADIDALLFSGFFARCRR